MMMMGAIEGYESYRMMIFIVRACERGRERGRSDTLGWDGTGRNG